MLSFIFGVAVGLVLGWVVLPEPAFVRDWWARITAYVRPTKTP